MAEKRFSISEAVNFGWDCMRKNLGFFVGLLIAVGLFHFAFDKITKALKENPMPGNLLLGLFFAVASIFLQMGLIRISLKFASGEKGSFRDFLGNGRLFFRFCLASILFTLIVSGPALFSVMIYIIWGSKHIFLLAPILIPGMLFSIMFGIIWSVQFGLFTYLIIDKNTKIVDSLKKSSKITQGEKWRLFLFYLLLCLINFAGFLCLIIGLFATIPTTLVAAAYVYKKLLDSSPQPLPAGSEIK